MNAGIQGTAPSRNGMPAADPRHAVLLEHARCPRNRRELASPTHRGTGSNPLCGDSVAVTLTLADDEVREVAFKGRGCTVCMASASLMTELVGGKTLREIDELCAGFRQWVADDRCAWNAPSVLAPLGLVRGRLARRRCLMLSWEALADALR